MKEIERKFLVDPMEWDKIDKGVPNRIKQGYLSKSVDSTVRVRIYGEKAYLTLKGKTQGISRDEFEYEIPYNEAEEILNLFCKKFISKDRYLVDFDKKTWEIDIFHGNLSGLILAEIELKDENENFMLPPWIGKEVSDDPGYFNAVLIEKC